MCLCEGTGNVKLKSSFGNSDQVGIVDWHKCPDSNCAHDKEQAEKNWQKVRRDILVMKQRALKEGFKLNKDIRKEVLI